MHLSVQKLMSILLKEVSIFYIALLRLLFYYNSHSFVLHIYSMTKNPHIPFSYRKLKVIINTLS